MIRSLLLLLAFAITAQAQSIVSISTTSRRAKHDVGAEIHSNGIRRSPNPTHRAVNFPSSGWKNGLGYWRHATTYLDYNMSQYGARARGYAYGYSTTGTGLTKTYDHIYAQSYANNGGATAKAVAFTSQEIDHNMKVSGSGNSWRLGVNMKFTLYPRAVLNNPGSNDEVEHSVTIKVDAYNYMTATWNQGAKKWRIVGVYRDNIMQNRVINLYLTSGTYSKVGYQNSVPNNTQFTHKISTNWDHNNPLTDGIELYSAQGNPTKYVRFQTYAESKVVSILRLN